MLIVILLTKICKNKIQKLFKKIKEILIWNFLIRYFYASYLNFFFSSVNTLVSNNSSVQEKVVSGFIIGIQLIVNLLFSTKLYLLHPKALDHNITKKKIGFLYENL